MFGSVLGRSVGSSSVASQIC